MEFNDILIAYKLTEDLLKNFSAHDVLGHELDSKFQLPEGMMERFQKIYDDIEEINEEIFNMKVEVIKEEC